MSVMPGAVRRPTPAQARAADPGRSVWVTANAGTGKTGVLTDRVLRLLLAGAAPEGILCLTFTKAAAAEMIVRVEDRLARWATADEAGLRAELEALLGGAPDAALLARARRLFTAVLDLPQGLQIMTIHGLCGALLRRFPIEAGVAPHFETIDERTSRELIREAQALMLAEAAADPATPLAAALQVLAVTLAETTLRGALDELLAARTRIARLMPAGDIEELVARIRERLVCSQGDEPNALREAFCREGMDHERLVAAADCLARLKTKTHQAAGRVMLAWLGAAVGDRVVTFASYRDAFITKKGVLNAKLLTDKLREAEPALVAALVAEHARWLRMEDACRAILIARRTEALLRVGWSVIRHYERLKAQRAALDFDDLIERTRDLLERRADWVLFKLDQRLEHLLLDEAQDTSPAQWDIALRISEEFFAGAGQHERPRTLFVVGDEKQSIYSFQGADLAALRAVETRLRERAGAAWQAERLEVSFRSGPAVLELVDGVLALQAEDGNAAVRHASARPNEAGLVEVWPLARPAEVDGEDQPWPLPGAPRPSDEPERAVAVAVATTIRRWLAAGERLAGSGRRIRPGDIMVLLRRRGVAQEQLIRALKREGIPVAGADRLGLTSHIAVQDLLALGRAALLPEDDLTLACLMKSPLVGLDDDDLMRLAIGRGPVSLLERLRELAPTDDRLAAALARINGWLRRADFAPPFEFFCHVLGAEGGRERLLARLGREALEPIEAFLGQCLAYEQGHPASLQGFLHWLDLGDQELRRDPEGAADAVRVLTVHGAKGLEAPIVFLTDCGPYKAAPPDRLVWDGDSGLPFWRSSKDDLDPVTREACRVEARAQADEADRLLYVAMTRARERLYVTGWLGSGEARRLDNGENASPSWHATVARALRDLPRAVEVVTDLGPRLPGSAWRIERGVATPPRDAAAAPDPSPTVPAWLRQPVPDEPAAARPLAPSRAGDDGPGFERVAGEAAGRRIRRGLLTHKLLELVPSLPEEARAAAAARWLAAIAPDLSPDERAGLVAEVEAVLAMPALAAVFGPDSLAEQALCGTVAGQAVVGQVDRLLVTADAVLVVDFKTGRGPPAEVGATPAAYLRQMALYRALLRDLYPGREIRCGLLWTEGPRLDLLPDSLLDLPEAAPLSPAA